MAFAFLRHSIAPRMFFLSCGQSINSANLIKSLVMTNTKTMTNIIGDDKGKDKDNDNDKDKLAIHQLGHLIKSGIKTIRFTNSFGASKICIGAKSFLFSTWAHATVISH